MCPVNYEQKINCDWQKERKPLNMFGNQKRTDFYISLFFIMFLKRD